MKLQGPELEAWLERRRAEQVYSHQKADARLKREMLGLYPMLGLKAGRLP